MTDPGQYAWISDSELEDAACIAAVPNASVDELLARLSVDRSQLVDPADAYDGDCVAVMSVPGGAIAVEPNGFRGSRVSLLTRLAGGGTAASMYWNVNALNAFTCIRPGEAVVSVDMLHAETDDDAESMAELGLPLGLHEQWLLATGDGVGPWAAGLAMVEAATGIVVPPEAATPAEFYRLEVHDEVAESAVDEPRPDQYAPPTDGLNAMRSFMQRIEELRARGGQLTGEASLELTKVVVGSPAKVFKKALWVHGWPTSNGAKGAWILKIGNQVLHDATDPDTRRGVSRHGGIYTRITTFEPPDSVAWAWNWVIPDVDGYTRWQSDRLLRVDSTVTITLTTASGRGEEPSTRFDLLHSHVPDAWLDDLRQLWSWHLEQVLAGKTYW